MNETLTSLILEKTGASALYEKEVIQSLWSGYGRIIRFELEDAAVDSVVVKHVQLPSSAQHPRGWNTDIGHQRKVKSYQVEAKWYTGYSAKSKARLPECYGVMSSGNEMLIVLEDLNEAGYDLRKQSVTWEEVESCLAWLARFHATYLGEKPNGLWEEGTYWHLETRPQELEALKDLRLRGAAAAIDEKLKRCKYKTFVHGDAKLANFCFSKSGDVAGVDFQYVGGGCGMKDVAYFMGSCLDERQCERLENQILDTYFDNLQMELEQSNDELEAEWRSLYRVAWADFHRFLKGWSPDHWKINSYSERVTAQVIDSLT